MGVTRQAGGAGATDFASRISLDEHTFLCAMAGNPNVGKSSLFNGLTGLHQHTGNWTGKTVGCTVGKMKRAKSCPKGENSPDVLLADLPGCYSLDPHSAEEQAALDFLIEQPVTAAVVVCEASNLSRNLLLAYQIRALSKPIPVILCINLMDEAERRGFSVDADALSTAMGCPVVLTSARNKRGMDDLKSCILRTCTERPTVSTVKEADPHQQAEKVAAAYVRCHKGRENGDRPQRRVDHLVMGKWTAIPVALLLLGVVFWLTVAGANIPSAWLSKAFAYVGDLMAAWPMWSYFPSWVGGLLLDGVYRTLTWVVAVMLPPMAIFFPLFTLMEDVGLLPRIAFNFDRCFYGCRACGKQALTMCMGVGCNAAGVTGCRIIDSPRERMIAILTNSLVPCNGKFPTLLAMATVFFSAAGQGTWQGSLYAALILLSMVALSVAVTLLASRVLSATVLKGEASAFLLELPPYRVPRIGQVLIRSVLDRTLLVLGRAVTVAAPAGALLWICANVTVGEGNLLTVLASVLDPVGWLLCVDGAVLLALMLSLPANELTLPVLLMIYSAGGRLTDYGTLSELGTVLTTHGWSMVTAICFTALFLFHAPCSTTLMTVKKETGKWRWVAMSAIIPCIVGLGICLAVRLVTSLIG